MRTHPNVRHMAALFDFPPPYCALPRTVERDTLADPLIGEFSDWGRDRAGWSTVAVVFASILVPFGVAIVAIARGWIVLAHHL